MRDACIRNGASEVLVTIVMPIYNAERHLEEALDDIRRQTYRNLEVILINDGSTDGSLEIIKRFVEEDSRFQCVSQKNAGPGAARNRGLDIAMGEYIIFLDADDRFEPNMIERMETSACNTDADVCICGFTEFYERAGSPCFDTVDSHCRLSGYFPIEEARDALILEVNPQSWNKLFRTKLLRGCKFKFKETRRWEDVYFVYMCLFKARSLAFIDDKLLQYRVSNFDSLMDTVDALDYAEYSLPAYSELQASLKDEGLLTPNVKKGIDYRVAHLVIRAFKALISDSEENRRAFLAIHNLVRNDLKISKISYFRINSLSVSFQYRCLIATSFQGLLSISGHFGRGRRRKNNACKKAINAGVMLAARFRCPYHDSEPPACMRNHQTGSIDHQSASQDIIWFPK